ncbi:MULTISPECIES: NAD-dependent epimerase/dehydratase family protein [Aphanothece]|uniref:NAD-dependent epimerase/dehydratase family protein n=1 Tax=Aphanothece TaxID=1121 RepID=UPI0039848005
MRIAVSGATGFIGTALVGDLSRDHAVMGFSTRALDPAALKSFAPTHLVHAAAIAHRRPPRSAAGPRELHQVNVHLAGRTAALAARLGLERMLFLSSIGVHGAATAPGEAISEASPLRPGNPYAASKLEAEQLIRRTLAGTATRLTILRPALVYGPGAPGNLALLRRCVDAGLPLPLGAVANRRSLIALPNLIDLIHNALLHPAAADRTYVAADAETIATPELIRLIARARHRPCRLFPLPTPLLAAAGRLPVLGPKLLQLSGNLVVDSSLVRRDLGWQQPVDQRSALEAAFSPEPS